MSFSSRGHIKALGAAPQSEASGGWAARHQWLPVLHSPYLSAAAQLLVLRFPVLCHHSLQHGAVAPCHIISCISMHCANVTAVLTRAATFNKQDPQIGIAHADLKAVRHSSRTLLSRNTRCWPTLAFGHLMTTAVWHTPVSLHGRPLPPPLYAHNDPCSSATWIWCSAPGFEIDFSV